MKFALKLKFLSINYPENIHQFFSSSYSINWKIFFHYTFKENCIRDLILIENNFEIYEISPYFLNNFGD